MANRCVVPILCCVIVLTAVGCAGVGPQPTDPRITEEITANQEKAVDIINALAEYRQSAGAFPEGLEELVPGYLSAIPETVAGDRFRYEPDELAGYYLCFDVPGYRCRGCCFHQRVCLWDCTCGAE
jgi:hypothetical protein